jgi:DNA-binding NarL/FixJ family response regulator
MLASRVDFDVVLCDMHLSGFGAMAFCAALERTNPALAARTILLEEGSHANRPRTTWAGRRVLHKNANASQLVAAIASAVSESMRAAS